MVRFGAPDEAQPCAETNGTIVLLYAKSGNKLPTIVQKVYLRLVKIVHEIVKKFFSSE